MDAEEESDESPAEEAALRKAAARKSAAGDGALPKLGAARALPSYAAPLSSQSRPPWESLFSPPPTRGAFCVAHDGADALDVTGGDAAAAGAFRAVDEAAAAALVRVRIVMQRRGTPKPCATLYAAAGPSAVTPIGFVTSGQYSERQGRGVAIAFVTRRAAMLGGVLDSRSDARCGVLLRNPGKEGALRPAWMST